MFEIKKDTFIEIGSQHKICEDYIISGDNYIILTDGCSSSENSEMGARFLCYMAKQFIKTYGFHPLDDKYASRLGDWTIFNAENLVRQLGLNRTCLDATLIIACLKDNIINIIMYGDGYVIAQPDENFGSGYKIICVDYKSGSRSMPFYLRYLIDSEGLSLYHQEKVTKSRSVIEILKDGTVTKPSMWETAYDIPLQLSYPVENFKSISISSDGLGSFLRPVSDESGNKIMGPEDMVPFIFDFKNSTGVFLQREINICRRQLKKINLEFEHFDDLSIGTFLKEETPNAYRSEIK